MTQGTHEPLDLNALFTARALKPRRVTVAGIAFDVRRDLSSDEVVEFFTKSANGRQMEALAMLVGDESAREIDDKLAILPVEHVRKIYRRIMQVAGVLERLPEDEHDDGGAEGESSASSPQS
ncbi:hypothetical protein ACWEV3_40990 [Saccharopolyspora sp. NPDC003752]